MTETKRSVRSDERDRALRRWREARIAAGPALRRQADRRRRRGVLALRAVAAIAVVGLAAAIAVSIAAHRGESAQSRGEQAQTAARGAMTTMLTADPADPTGYVDAVLAVITGDLHKRIAGIGDQVASEIARQDRPSTGQVLSVSLVAEPGTSGDVEVLVVAEATHPELIGFDTTAKRFPVVVMMRQVDGRWLMSGARQA